MKVIFIKKLVILEDKIGTKERPVMCQLMRYSHHASDSMPAGLTTPEGKNSQWRHLPLPPS